MRKLILLGTLLCAMAPLFSASPARAQNVLLWVSATGNDANPCTPVAPCASFQGAINKGNVNQINCLNSGNYAPFTITASITIDCGTGNVGAVAVGGGNAITINTNSAANIVLRHLSLNGLGTAGYGIQTNTFWSGSLIVEDCMIHGFHSAYGIFFAPISARGLLQVSNSQIFDNFAGIVVQPPAGQIASVTLNQVELVGNASVALSLNSLGVIAGTMRHSIVASNGTTGVFANAGQVFFTVEESSIVNNLANGIFTSSAGTVVNVGASTIGGNGTGVLATAGQLISFGDNHMSANGTNGNFTSTTTLR